MIEPTQAMKDAARKVMDEYYDDTVSAAINNTEPTFKVDWPTAVWAAMNKAIVP